MQRTVPGAAGVWAPAGEQAAVLCAREVLAGVPAVGECREGPGAAGRTGFLPGSHRPAGRTN